MTGNLRISHLLIVSWALSGLPASCAGSGGASSRQGGGVRPGIEVLVEDSFHLVAGKRLGILTNQTGVDRRGRGDVELLLEAGLTVTTIFSPEHGFRGRLDREGISDDLDSVTGLPVVSLYGDLREPTPEMLSGLDLLLIDLQDVGARPYTYISTALGAMLVAAGAGVHVVVLDRPNPIGGEAVQGPIIDGELKSFVGMLSVPLRHGMTFGELARYGRSELDMGGELTVIPAAGWTREQWFDRTGLPWVRPSPNLPDLESATHYPGLVIFEGTNLSVGRGTGVAFQVLGAPWMDPAQVRAELDGAAGAGVEIVDTVVVPVDPGDGKYSGARVRAVMLRVVERDVYDPVRTALGLLAAVARVHGDSLEVRAAVLDRRLGSAAVRRAVISGSPVDSVARAWVADLEGFRRARRPFLLYR